MKLSVRKIDEELENIFFLCFEMKKMKKPKTSVEYLSTAKQTVQCRNIKNDPAQIFSVLPKTFLCAS